MGHVDAVERFANAAAAFQRWAVEGGDSGSTAARVALAHLAELFAAALALPRAEEEGPWPPGAEVPDGEWRAVFAAAERLPVRHYAVVFDPLTCPSDAPATGDVADDLADVYRDVVGGLRALAAGDTSGAVWHWQFTFWSHWGRHAVGAMGALRAWLADQGMS